MSGYIEHYEVIAEFFGVPADDIHTWSDGTYTVGDKDVVDYYVVDAKDAEEEERVRALCYEEVARYTASDDRGYIIFSNGMEADVL